MNIFYTKNHSLVIFKFDDENEFNFLSNNSEYSEYLLLIF